MPRTNVFFYDASNPANIASGVHAAYYVNGYAWPKSEIDRMGAVFGVSVLPESYWAKVARCIDIETGAASVENAVPFIRARRKFLLDTYGHNYNDDATCYVNRSNMDAVREAFTVDHLPEPLYWVATLDGTWEVDGAWAVQGQGGPTAAYDLSILHGVYNFHKP